MNINLGNLLNITISTDDIPQTDDTILSGSIEVPDGLLDLLNNLTTMSNSNPIQQINIKTNYGSLNGDTTNNFYGDNTKKHHEEDNGDTEYEEVSENDTSSIHHPLPPELSTEKAMLYWQKLQAAGFVDENYQPIGLHKSQMMYIADCMADKLHLRYRWSSFEKHWHVTGLADAKYDMQRTGEAPPRSKEILSIF